MGVWTINLKSFEIEVYNEGLRIAELMNYKLEKFWNSQALPFLASSLSWTINLKSFEIVNEFKILGSLEAWTINLKSFEINNIKSHF